MTQACHSRLGAVEQGPHQALAALEAPEHRALADAGALGDGVHGDAVDAAVVDELGRGAQQRLAVARGVGPLRLVLRPRRGRRRGRSMAGL